MGRGNQVARQWRILRRIELSRQNGVTTAELADSEACHERTIYRDLEALQEAGFPLVDNREGSEAARWTLLKDHSPEVSIPFSYSELLALHIAHASMRLYTGTPFYQALETVYGKVRATLPPKAAHFMAKVEERFAADQVPILDYGSHGAGIEKINQAILAQKTLHFDYFTLYRKSEEPRRARSYFLRAHAGGVYLIGYCHDREEWRTFAVQRMKKVEIGGETFTPDPKFSIEAFLADSFQVYHGKVTRVVIQFSSQVAPLIEERIHHPSQRLEKKDDGSLLLTMETGGLEEVKRWVLSYGRDAVVLEPTSLRRDVGQAHQVAFQQYT